MNRYTVDDAPHLSSEFSRNLPSWEDLLYFIDTETKEGGLTADRVLTQIFAIDIMSRFTLGRTCMAVGSLTLPARVDPHLRWPPDFLHTAPTTMEQAYVLSRTAGDLDLVEIDEAARAAHAQDPLDYGRRIGAAIEALAPSRGGIGLNGLVSYVAKDLQVTPSGQVQGEIVVTPDRSRQLSFDIPPRHPKYDQTEQTDRYVVPIDIKPPDRVRFTSPPEVPYRPYSSLDLPGFHPPTVPMYPTVNQLVDKLCAPGEVPHTNRKIAGPPPPRVKDLFDAYFLLRLCRFSSEDLRNALLDRTQARGAANEFRAPYELYGQRPIPSGQQGIDWITAYNNFKDKDPSLQNYPPFADVYQLLNQCVTGLAAQRGEEWVPDRGWVNLVPAMDVDRTASRIEPTKPPRKKGRPAR